MDLRRITAASAGLLLLAGGAAACSDDDSVFSAEVGRCVEDVSDLVGAVSDLPQVDCTDDHDGEVFFLFEHEGDDDDYPGGEALQAEAADDCEGDAFEDYTGTSYSESAIFVGYITPSEQSWSQGDRESICVASTGSTVDVSFEDNGDDFLLGSGDGTSGGDDTSTIEFAGLISACQEGDLASCDELYRTTPVGSEAEEIGATCGGRSDTPLNGSCESELG